MLKIVGSNAWAGKLWSEENPRSAIIKVASNGLSGMDKQAFVKRACSSSDELLAKIASMDVKPGEELVHLIALGSTEAYGPNRNGDGFSKEACRKYHPCFVKHAKVYRDHKNDDKSKSYGIVKASAFNEEMSRVELIVSLNRTKEAAKANNGLVADREMEKLASGKDIPWSMACSVPFDICSCCGNKAIKQSDYCLGKDEGGTCAAGGLRHNMGKIASVNGELKQLYAINTEPDFFDISHVFIPADRIAYSSGRLTKQASANFATNMEYGGAELARRMCITSPERFGDPKVARALQFLKKAVYNFHNHRLYEKRASFITLMNFKQLKNVEVPRRYKMAELQRAMVDSGCCFTPSQFIQLMRGGTIKEAALLGEIIAPLSNDLLESSGLVDTQYGASYGAPTALRNWVADQGLPSVNPENMFKQAALASCMEAPEFKFTRDEVYEMADDPDVSNLAAQFALYKLGFVSELPRDRQQIASELLVGRDYMSF